MDNNFVYNDRQNLIKEVVHRIEHVERHDCFQGREWYIDIIVRPENMEKFITDLTSALLPIYGRYAGRDLDGFLVTPESAPELLGAMLRNVTLNLSVIPRPDTVFDCTW